jgi:hypothetical protein
MKIYQEDDLGLGSQSLFVSLSLDREGPRYHFSPPSSYSIPCPFPPSFFALSLILKATERQNPKGQWVKYPLNVNGRDTERERENRFHKDRYTLNQDLLTLFFSF